MKRKKYNLVVCGGTFDLFHKGHKKFLLFGLAHSEKLLIGITSDDYVVRVKKHYPHDTFEERKKAVEEFLDAHDARGRVEILPFDSVYGPEKWSERAIEAIVVTQDTLSGAKKVNAKRVDSGKSPLVIIPFPLTLAIDGKPIASSRIQDGIIDREGSLWVESTWYHKTFILPTPLRKTLKKPFGEITDAKTYLFSEDEKKKLLAVGDVTVTLLHNRGIVPRFSVVDLFINRKQQFQTLAELNLKDVNLTYSAQNTPGQISPEVFQKIRDAFLQIKQGKSIILHITGEEDLTVLPMLLQAPLGYVLCYGQPGVGTVKVDIDEAIKKRTKTLLQKFTIGN